MNEPLENPYQSPAAPPGEESPSVNATLPAIVAGTTAFVSTLSILAVIVFIAASVLVPEVISRPYHPGGLAALGLCVILSLAAAVFVGRHVHRERKRMREHLVKLYQERDRLMEELQARRRDAAGRENP